MPKQSKIHTEPVVEAAGGLLWKQTPSGPQIALIHRERYDDWSLPKGKREAGESWQQTALREVFEETGCQAELESYAGATAYMVQNGAKIVLYWHMRLVGDGELKINTEVDALQWLSPEAALEALSYPVERALLTHPVNPPPD